MASRPTRPQITEQGRRHVVAVPLSRALERDGQELVQDGLDINVTDSSAHGHRHQRTAKPVMPRKRLGHRNGEASPHPAPPHKNQQLIQKWPGSSPSDARSPIIPPSTPALRPRLLSLSLCLSLLFSDSILLYFSKRTNGGTSTTGSIGYWFIAEWQRPTPTGLSPQTQRGS